MTIAMQNYLELIYELSLDGKKARVSVRLFYLQKSSLKTQVN